MEKCLNYSQGVNFKVQSQPQNKTLAGAGFLSTILPVIGFSIVVLAIVGLRVIYSLHLILH